jgi:integrase
VKTLHFLDYVDALREKGTERLFPELKLSRDGYAQQFSKWFNRTYRKNTNVGMEKDESKNFHSFRHTFINFYKQRGTEEYRVSEYVGQQPQTATAYGRYGKKQSLKDMKKLIELLKLDFLDFSSIRKWK